MAGQGMTMINEKLNDENYEMWAHQMKFFLKAKQVWPEVEGTRPRPDKAAGDENKTAMEDWILANDKAMYWLSASVGPSVFEHIKACETAREIWEKLAGVYEKIDEQDKLAASTAFHSYKYDGTKTMANHVSVVDNLAKKVRQLGDTLAESYVIGKMLQGLPERFSGVVTGLRFIPEKEKTAKTVAKILVQEEVRMGEVEVVEGLAAHVRGFRPRGRGRAKAGQASRSQIECFKCHKMGHFKRDCPEWKNNQEENVMYAADGFSGYNCAFSAHWKMAKVPVEDQWVADSGASAHMTGRRDWFMAFEDCQEELVLADGQTMVIAGRGTISLKRFVRGRWYDGVLLDAAYVPGLKNNLYSVGAAACHGFTAMFSDDGLVVAKDKMEMATGTKTKNNMYIMNIYAEVKGNRAMFAQTAEVKNWRKSTSGQGFSMMCGLAYVKEPVAQRPEAEKSPAATKAMAEARAIVEKPERGQRTTGQEKTGDIVVASYAEAVKKPQQGMAKQHSGPKSVGNTGPRKDDWHTPVRKRWWRPSPAKVNFKNQRSNKPAEAVAKELGSPGRWWTRGRLRQKSAAGGSVRIHWPG
ncbi:Retrovirus-related Pol polyprotein from transposon TNT 1-94 [Halotydeus destructor]|nr:Retrovirus-related Pol polyprotein from transposon TNT 1-94 [Halotydeus destructor]